MSKPRYEDCLRKELEENKTLTNKERMEILKALAKIEGKKIELAKTRIVRGWGKPVKKEKLRPIEIPFDPLPAEETPAVPMGQQIDKFLAEYQKNVSGESSAAIEEKQDGNRKLDEPAGQDGHQPEDAAVDSSGS
jgi:hypothetical protein